MPLTATEYYRAKVDPIAPVSRPIIDRINQNFKQEMIKFTKEQLDIIITDAFLCELDRCVANIDVVCHCLYSNTRPIAFLF